MPEKPDNNNEKYIRLAKTFAFWLLIAAVAYLLYEIIGSMNQKPEIELGYNTFLSLVEDGQIESTNIKGKRLSGEFKPNSPYISDKTGTRIAYEKYFLYIPFEDPELLEILRQNDVDIKTTSIDDSPWMILIRLLPWLFIPLIVIFLMRQFRSNQKGIFTFGKSKAILADTEKEKVTFSDVAGCDEAKNELEEVVEFLKSPLKFSRLGGKVPKGLLLLGAPGTGKTLLAKAVAGEAGVPFFSMSGSDFVEMFVGVGASRVRDLFETGKKNAPCIIFIDEIDAVGRHRGAGLGGGHDEREQTLNQLLVAMDGFNANEGIIVIAATNRPDILDPALLRPGRFDRRVIIDRPDVKGRQMIFEIHAKKIKTADDINFKRLAQMTPGMVGADIANIVNEAALIAAKNDKKQVDNDDFEEAKDKILLGVERKSTVLNPKEKKITAYHESGHALVAWFANLTDRVDKISIIPRGMAMGVTHFAPREEKKLLTRKYLKSLIAQMLGGRAAELIIFSDPSNGAQNDIERATDLAHKMVCSWGMSEKLGPQNYSESGEDIFLGKEIVRKAHVSDKIAEVVDREVHELIEEGQKRAHDIIKEHIDKLHKIAEELLEKEVLESDMIEKLFDESDNTSPESA
ncbi:MAG: ATP-dependent zinc metalloprotease FtsH [Candidatus Zixiibacteriota bacterium]